MSQAFAGLFHHPRTSSAAFSAVIRMSASTAGTAKLSDESGVEVFYDLASTPAVRLIPSYQRIWNPFSARSSPTKITPTSFSLVSLRRGEPRIRETLCV